MSRFGIHIIVIYYSTLNTLGKSWKKAYNTDVDIHLKIILIGFGFSTCRFLIISVVGGLLIRKGQLRKDLLATYGFMYFFLVVLHSDIKE